MKQDMDVTNTNDENGNPHGGTVRAKGLDIRWQEGPLGRGVERKEPNGCFVETVIAASISRIEYYQASQFNCATNQEALDHLNKALAALERRTAEREARGVEGTHEVTTEDGIPANGQRSCTVYVKDSEFAPEPDGSSTMVAMVATEPFGAQQAISGFEQTGIKAVIARLQVYQAWKDCCPENREAIDLLNQTLKVLGSRPPLNTPKSSGTMMRVSEIEGTRRCFKMVEVPMASLKKDDLFILVEPGSLANDEHDLDVATSDAYKSEGVDAVNCRRLVHLCYNAHQLFGDNFHG